MKAITFVTKSLKESVQLITTILYVAIGVEILLYISFQAAITAHIPFTNFILFLKSIMAVLGVSFLGAAIFVFFLGRENKFTKQRIYKLIIYILLLMFSFFVSDFGIPLNVSLFERIVDVTGQAALYSLIGFCLSFLANRVAINALFRQLFTEEFQSRCVIYPDEETIFYSISWIRRIMNFITKHFRNAQETRYTANNQGIAESELVPYLSGVKAYKEKPIRFENEHGGIRLIFKWIPVSFVFYERMSFSKAIEPPTKLGTKALLSNEKQEK